MQTIRLDEEGLTIAALVVGSTVSPPASAP